jgi:hypothetical protein
LVVVGAMLRRERRRSSTRPERKTVTLSFTAENFKMLEELDDMRFWGGNLNRSYVIINLLKPILHDKEGLKIKLAGISKRFDEECEQYRQERLKKDSTIETESL